MKSKLFLLLAILSIGFTSCDTKSESNFTPEISVYPKLIVNKADTLKRLDTLSIYLTNKLGEYLLDTINVGDTVVIPVVVDGIANKLTAFNLIQSADSLTTILFPVKSSLDQLFLSTSNYAEGKFIPNGTFTSLYFPFKYVAKKPSNDAKLTITVASDAVFKDFSGTNSKSFVLKTPIAKAK